LFRPVVLQRARPQTIERLDEARPGLRQIDRRLVGRLDPQHLQRHAVAPLVAGMDLQPERRLAQDPQPEILGERQDVGQRDRLPGMEQAHREAMRRHAGAPAQPHAEVAALQRPLQRLDIGDRLPGIEAVAIGRGEPGSPAAIGLSAFDLAELLLQGDAQPVVPRGRGVSERALELGEIGRGAVRRVELDGVERLGERGIGAAGAGDRGHRAVPGGLQDVAEALGQRRVEALARREHQAACEAADRIAAREQRHAMAFLQLQDSQRMVVQRGRVDLEQLVARIGIEDGEQRLAVMAVGIEAGARQHRFDAAAQQRHLEHRRVIGGRGEQAGETPLAGGVALGVVGLDDHAIHRTAAMDQRLAVGLDDQQRLGPAREARHRLATAQARIEQADLVTPQDAQRRAGNDLVAQAAGVRRILDIAIAAVAEEGEVVGLQPAQELLLLDGVRGLQIRDRVEPGLSHGPPVGDRAPHFGQHAAERRGEIVELCRLGLPVDLDVHHRFGSPTVGIDLQQVAVEVAPHREDGMGEQMNGKLAPVQLVGDRIDQERHVVVDDLHDGVPALEAVLGRGRIEDADLGHARQPVPGERQQGERRPARCSAEAPARSLSATRA
jgi:hypothetical protein